MREKQREEHEREMEKMERARAVGKKKAGRSPREKKAAGPPTEAAKPRLDPAGREVPPVRRKKPSGAKAPGMGGRKKTRRTV